MELVIVMICFTTSIIPPEFLQIISGFTKLIYLIEEIKAKQQIDKILTHLNT